LRPEPSSPCTATGLEQADAVPPDLARIIAAWPTLPAPIRRAILALIQNG
jgi:hypothetical protein